MPSTWVDAPCIAGTTLVPVQTLQQTERAAAQPNCVPQDPHTASLLVRLTSTLLPAASRYVTRRFPAFCPYPALRGDTGLATLPGSDASCTGAAVSGAATDGMSSAIGAASVVGSGVGSEGSAGLSSGVELASSAAVSPLLRLSLVRLGRGFVLVLTACMHGYAILDHVISVGSCDSISYDTRLTCTFF